MELGALFRMAGLSALHPPGPPKACGMVAPGTPSGGRSSRHARSLAASPSIASWVAGQGREHEEVRQMSWSSGKAKKEVGNLSDKPQQAKVASATGRKLSVIFPLLETSVTLHSQGNLALVQPVRGRKWMKRTELSVIIHSTQHFLKAYIVQCTGLEAVAGGGGGMAVYNTQGCPKRLGSRMEHVQKGEPVAIKRQTSGENATGLTFLAV